MLATDTATVCLQLQTYSHLRGRVMRRQRLINQPAEQEFAHELRATMNGEADGKSHQQMLAWGKRLRDVAFRELGGRKLKKGQEPPTDKERVVIGELLPFIEVDRLALASFDAERKRIEAAMVELASSLPVAEWWGGIRGCGMLGLAVVIGATGDLSNYATVSKVWKRLGLAPIKGKACSTWKREGGLTAQEWTEAGYNPRRRSAMFTIGEPLIKLGDTYRDIYLKEKEKKTAQKADDPKWTKLRIHRHSQRYMEKELIKHLWKAWRPHKD